MKNYHIGLFLILIFILTGCPPEEEKDTNDSISDQEETETSDDD